MPHYDAIVLGAGGVGSAALWQLARRGSKVLGLDRFQLPHDRGSSHGQTRIIRQAYFEHPDYVPLLLETYRLWSELESLAHRRLYHEVGLIEIGPPDGTVVPGVLRAAAGHNLPVEELTAAQIESRWPGLRVPQNLIGVLESRAGYLLVEQCIEAQLTAALQAGARLQCPVEVERWHVDDPIRLETNVGQFTADRLIITAGAWASQLLANSHPPPRSAGEGTSAPGTLLTTSEYTFPKLKVQRQSLFWYATEGDDYSAKKGFPCFLFELPAGVFYGFPKLDERGIKVANHGGGKPVDDPLGLDRSIHGDDRQEIEKFLSECLPQATLQCTDHAACMYTMSPDEHFLVDRHPACPQVVFAAGLSGHGFKFAPVLGQALVDLALNGKTDLPIGFLSLERFGE